MAAPKKPRFVDVSNPNLTVVCPSCGLITARFLDHCRNCGYKLWPSSQIASAAFKAWQSADPERRRDVSRFDMDFPVYIDNTVDYVARARQLGIHLFPNSSWPFVISFGALFLALAAIPFSSTVRIVLAVIGGIILVWGVVGWVLIEDVKMFPDDSAPAHGEAPH